MSWSSDIRCLYCDGKLPLYRKITNGQFCSAAHRRSYWQEQERLGVERLHQTHDSLRAYRAPEGAEAILGHYTLPPPPPAPAEMIATAIEAKQDERPRIAAADPYAYESDLAPQTPLWAPQIASPQEVEPPALAGFIELNAVPRPRWPVDVLEAPEPKALAPTGRVRLPLRRAVLATDVLAAGIAAIPVEPRSYEGARHVEPVNSVILPCRDVPRETAPTGSALASADDVPRAEKLLALAAFAARESDAKAGRRDPWPAAPFATLQRERLSLWTMEVGKRNGGCCDIKTPPLAGLRPLSIEKVPLVHGTWIDNLRALGSEGESPRYELSTPALRPRLRLAEGSRYPVVGRDTAVAVATIEPENLQPPAAGIAIPMRQPVAQAGSASSPAEPVVQTPPAAGLVPMASTVKPNEPPVLPAPHAPSANLPQPLRTEPMRPASHLEPLDSKPIADFIAPAPVEEKPVRIDAPLQSAPADEMPRPGSIPVPQTAWEHVTGFWHHAPRDLKLLVFGLPILLALAMHPTVKKVPFTAQDASGIEKNIQRNFQSKLNDQWLQVRQSMSERAAVALDEDFRAGLDDWASRGGTTEWAFDATGFVRPGPLAIYRPSVDLADYQMQFLGLIDKKALSWVVRAADFDDYYVVKLEVLKPGPLPTIGLTRYAVINGVAQNRVDTPVFINARQDMLYRVHMDVHGDVFALTVQGQMIDSWSEPRLKKGGVGFFTARGEASRLRWVQVTHQYDMLGRLCAYLAPYNIPSTNGSWEP